MSAHGTLVNACIQLITARGGMAWKNHSGTLPVGNRYVHVGTKGLPDVIGVWPWCHLCGTAGKACAPLVGRLIAVEVKTGLGRVSKNQAAMHEELRKRGALVVIVRSIVDLEKALC